MASSVPLQRSLLEDSIRTILQQGEAAQVKAGTVAYVPSTPSVSKSADPDSMCCPATVSTGDEELPNEDAEASTPTCIRVEDLPEHIPSIGSLNHDKGDCRRCNFFHKGRCSNGRSCAFCHFPHEKRKTKNKEEQVVGTAEESIGMRGAPGLDPPAQLTPRMVPVTMVTRPAKVSMGTQTEDDLPPCLLCSEPPSTQDLVPPKSKVWKKAVKEDKSWMKEDQAGDQGKAHAARIGGC
jgi:hypothetical protein